MKYIDISHYQATPDFDKLKAQVDGVIIRAGYGQNNIDKQFARNIAECNRVGIPCGVYWFSYACTADMAAKEAEYCLAAIKPYRVELPVCFDFEYDSVNNAKKKGVTVTALLANNIVKAFCDTVEKAGYYCMNYANPDFLSRYFTDTAKYDLWLAQWPNKPDLAHPPRACGIWQWGGKTYDGITTGTVDTNEAYRDYAEIIRRAGLNHLEDKPTAEPKEWYTDAVEWCTENGISDGTRLDEPSTRAEVMAMLYRFNQLLKTEKQMKS